jgi:hypothetical protein
MRVGQYLTNLAARFPNSVERVSLAYSVFQAALATIQSSHPGLTSKILRAQRLLLIVDVMLLGRDCLELYNNSVQATKESGLQGFGNPQVDQLLAHQRTLENKRLAASTAGYCLLIFSFSFLVI